MRIRDGADGVGSTRNFSSRVEFILTNSRRKLQKFPCSNKNFHSFKISITLHFLFCSVLFLYTLFRSTALPLSLHFLPLFIPFCFHSALLFANSNLRNFIPFHFQVDFLYLLPKKKEESRDSWKSLAPWAITILLHHSSVRDVRSTISKPKSRFIKETQGGSRFSPKRSHL